MIIIKLKLRTEIPGKIYFGMKNVFHARMLRKKMKK